MDFSSLQGLGRCKLISSRKRTASRCLYWTGRGEFSVLSGGFVRGVEGNLFRWHISYSILFFWTSVDICFAVGSSTILAAQPLFLSAVVFRCRHTFSFQKTSKNFLAGGGFTGGVLHFLDDARCMTVWQDHILLWALVVHFWMGWEGGKNLIKSQRIARKGKHRSRKASWPNRKHQDTTTETQIFDDIYTIYIMIYHTTPFKWKH